MCLRRNLQAVSISPAGARVGRERRLTLLGSTVDPRMEALFPSEAEKDAALLTVQIKVLETTLGSCGPRELGLLLGQECAAVGFHLFQSLH